MLLPVLLRAVFRSQVAAVAAFWVIWTAIPLLGFGRADTWHLDLPVWAAHAVLATVLVARFGLLATATAMFLGIQSIPVTLRLGAWYAQPALFAFALELGLAGFGLYACLAGRALSWRHLVED